MFIRIVYPNGGEILRECQEITISHLSNKDGHEEKDLVEFRVDGNPNMAYMVEKNGSQVYFMNNQGKTIDSYQWEFKNKSQVSS